MTMIINRNDWKEYFDRLSRDLRDFETTIELVSPEAGAQIVSAGLPLTGITFEEAKEGEKIEILIGAPPGTHLSHNVFLPKLVAFENGGTNGGTLDIEESDGTKTLIKFTDPRPARVARSENEGVAKSG